MRGARSSIEPAKNSLLTLAVMFFAMCIILLSQFSNDDYFTDDTPRVRVEDVRELSSDGDSSLDSGDGFIPNIAELSFFGLVFCLFIALTTCQVLAQRIHLAQIRPRSPPQ
jgi:hypothetical protein